MVTKITPLAPIVPYIAACASFRTVILSMSAGFNVPRSPWYPSMIATGEASPLVEIPRIRMLSPAPGAPDCVEIFTPATVPCKACSIFIGLISSIFSEFIKETAPVMSLLR